MEWMIRILLLKKIVYVPFVFIRAFPARTAPYLVVCKCDEIRVKDML